MGLFFAYILKTGVCLIAYYLFYKLLFSRETFHCVNRIALVGLMLASFLIPLLHFEMKRNVVTGTVDIEQELMMLSFTAVEAENSVSPQQLIFAWLLLAYFVGIAVMLVRFFIVYFSLYKTLKQGKRIEREGLGKDIKLIVHNETIAPFSWLNYIVVNEQDLKADAEAILTHEIGHIRQRHSWDLLLTELAQIVQWWNPAIWLMRRELQTIHEYEADEFVIRQGINAKQYQLLIIQKAVGCKLQSVNSLNTSFIKKRITMMLKNKSNPWAKVKYTLALPVAALCALVFATPQAEEVTKDLASSDWNLLFIGENVTVHTEEGVEFEAEKVEVYTHDDDVKETVFTVVEQQPEFPGGEVALAKFIRENLRYPEDCVKENIQGRVILSFIVTKDGTVTSPEQINSPDDRLTEEAKRVVLAMPKWKPGMQRGQNVNVKYVLPVTFRLTEDKKNVPLEKTSIAASTYDTGIEGVAMAKKMNTEEFRKWLFAQPNCVDIIAFVDGEQTTIRHTPTKGYDEVMVIEKPSQKMMEKYGEIAKNGIVVITTKK